MDYQQAATKSAPVLWQQPGQQLLSTVMDLHVLSTLFSKGTKMEEHHTCAW